jgi:hypothetical protein
MAHDVADARWCRPRRLRGQPPFQLTSRLRLQLRVLVVVDVVSFLVLLSASYVGFRFRLLCSRKSSMDGGAVIVDLAVFTLRTGAKSCSTSVYTPYRALYSWFPFRSWWRFLLVSAMFWTIRVHVGISPTDAGVQPARREMALSARRTRSMKASASGCYCMAFSYSNLRDSARFDNSFEYSGVGTLVMVRVTTPITIAIIHRNHTKHLICTGPRPGHGLHSHWLHQTGDCREFTTYSLLR